MEIICEKKELIDGINKVIKAVPNKTSMPILECILIEAAPSGVKLVSNNMEFGIETVINANIIKEGTIAIKAKRFFEFVRSMPEGNIKIETSVNNDSYLTQISANDTKFDINSFNGEEFTFLPYIEKSKPISISQSNFVDMVRKTSFSISINENNKQMTGELFEIVNNKLKMVSLDGNRISERYLDLGNDYDDVSVIIPGKYLDEIIKIIPGEMDKELDIYITKNHILFEFDKTIVVSRLIEGEYFNIKNFSIDEYETKVKVNKSEILECINRTTIMIREGEKQPIIINIDDEKMNFKIETTFGKFEQDVQVQKEGKDLRIGFNPNYLLDAIKAIDDEEIEIYFTSMLTHCYIKDENQTYIYLIFPIKIREEM